MSPLQDSPLEGSPLELEVSTFGQFGKPTDTFCLITSEDIDIALSGGEKSGYTRTMRLTLPPDKRLGELLTERVPRDAHVVSACPGRFLESLEPDELGDRQLAVLPAGSTPLTAEHVRYYLRAAARSDTAAQEALAEEFFDKVSASDRLLITDENTGTEAEFHHSDDTVGECVWNQQAGVLEPGEQQLLPPGKLSVTAADISTFRPEARLLGLTGELTLHGWPIVHRHADPADADEQAALFERLAALVSHPATLRVRAGVIEEALPKDDGARAAAEALNHLFEEDARYRTIWELGFGINTATEIIPANCGPNEVWGSTHGVVNLGIGVTPTTRFALAFLCPRSSLLASDGTAILGARKAVRRGRLRRQSSASCGCH